ncbi:hypothetical protein AXG93_2646s1030 [Marchantia polymorpha subsp. ruderalis]|uniref:Protein DETOXIFICATION n=1 Tax=Marchantia polymorpha subsp. ruderalis TaxID=1480154 RepID=A0A176W607_MARPO|nr:hypothetical protein AXG93_2646s1030 [Marchantia polymorpha subsp. ruderalis]
MLALMGKYTAEVYGSASTMRSPHRGNGCSGSQWNGRAAVDAACKSGEGSVNFMDVDTDMSDPEADERIPFKKHTKWPATSDDKVGRDEEEEETLNELHHALQAWPSIKQILSEISKQKKIGGPIAAMNIMWFARFIISTMFLGHLGGLELAGGTMALTFANVTGFSILMGLSGGMEPLCCQAFGAKRHKLIGLALQRGILLMLLACIPVSFAWLNVEKVLLWFGQDRDIAAMAKQYLIYLLPDLVATAVLSPLRIYLRSQCITKPMMLCSALAMSLHIPLNFFLVFGLKLGASGTALASALTDLNLIIMLVIYIHQTGIHRRSWPGWSRASLQDWGPFIKLAGPACLMTCLEWWCYETMTLLTGLLPDAHKAVAIMAIVLNGDTVCYALQVALSSCVSTRVGNELGANSPLAAYHASLAALSVSVALACLGATWLICARKIWGKLFTSDKDILLGVARLLPIMGLCEFGNFPQTVCCGVLRGSARPSTGAYANLGAFYLVGIPLGIYLAFSCRLGLLGLWLGLLAAVLTCAILTVTVVLRTDWILEALRAQHLTDSSHADLGSPADSFVSESQTPCLPRPPPSPPPPPPPPVDEPSQAILALQQLP